MKFGHIEGMRLYINRNMDQKRMFAIWRTEPLWKPVTKKGQGHRMGGGKKSVQHYIAPVKKGETISAEMCVLHLFMSLTKFYYITVCVYTIM